MDTLHPTQFPTAWLFASVQSHLDFAGATRFIWPSPLPVHVVLRTLIGPQSIMQRVEMSRTLWPSPVSDESVEVGCGPWLVYILQSLETMA